MQGINAALAAVGEACSSESGAERSGRTIVAAAVLVAALAAPDATVQLL